MCVDFYPESGSFDPHYLVSCKTRYRPALFKKQVPVFFYLHIQLNSLRMSFHTLDNVCPGCQMKLKQAHPTLVKWFNEEIKPAFHQAHISWSFRNETDQDAFLAEGKTQLAWPLSAHNQMSGGLPEARALDLFVIDSSHVAQFPLIFYEAVNQYTIEKGYSIQWGGLWKSLGDGDHYQLI